jgi:hypothetical protein
MIKLFNKKGDVVGIASCDQDDFDTLNKINWCYNSGYATGKVGGKGVLMHRYIMRNELCKHDGNVVVDHVDGNRLNNIKTNLRIVSKSQNNQNKPKQNESSSKYFGVCRRQYGSGTVSFTAGLMIEGKRLHIGNFKNEIEAAEAFDIFVLQLNDYASLKKLNFPDRKEEFMLREKIQKKEQIKTYRGIYKHHKKFVARAYIDGKKVEIARTLTDIEAAKKYDQYIVETKLNRELNFPEDYPNFAIVKTNGIIVDDQTYCLQIKDKPDQVVLIDQCEYDKIKYHTCYIGEGYVKILINTKRMGLHRFIMGITDPNVFIDHVNGNPLDNRRNNLRLSNAQLNATNTTKRKNTSSNYIGVSKHKSGKWSASVTSENKKYSKMCESEEYAARYRDLYIMNNFPHAHYKMNFTWSDEEKVFWMNKLKLVKELEA